MGKIEDCREETNLFSSPFLLNYEGSLPNRRHSDLRLDECWEGVMIYFDNAATTLQKPIEVAEAVYEAILHFGNGGRGATNPSLQANRMIYETRELIAALFHCSDPSRVAFTANSTESLNMAIKGMLRSGDHVITTVLEHNSVLRPLYQLEQSGVELSVVPCRENGRFEVEDMRQYIQKNTRAIVCTHVSNLTGNKIDIHAVGQLCREQGILFILDASQSAGVFPIDMEEDGIDAICFTGHKSLYGPQGTGGICLGYKNTIRPLKVGGSGIMTFEKVHPTIMPTALEAGTLNGHGIAGLHAGVSYVLEQGCDRIHAYEIELAKQFYNGIKDLPGITLYGDFSTWERAGIVTFNISDYDSALVSDELNERFGIQTRAGGHCAPLMHQTFGTERQGAVRCSFSNFNTKEEIQKGIEAVRTLVYE